MDSVWRCDKRAANVKEIKQIKCDTRQRVPNGTHMYTHHMGTYIYRKCSILSIKSFNIYNPFAVVAPVVVVVMNAVNRRRRRRCIYE